MKKRVFFYGIMISAASVLVCGLLTGILIHNMSLNSLKNHLRDSVRLLITCIDTNDTIQTSLDHVSSSLQKNDEGYDIRFTVIDANGTVLADSHHEATVMENHEDRPEIVTAQNEAFGSAYRYSKTLKKKMLYVATQDDKMDIIVRAAAPIEDVNAIVGNIVLFCLIGLGGGVIISLLLSVFLSPALVRPANELAAACHRISAGNYDQRIVFNTHTEFDTVAEDFNKMADKLSQTVGELHERNQQLDMILSSMEDGLVAVDENKNIIFLNPIAARLFEIKGSMHPQGKKLDSLIENANVRTLVSQCIETRQSDLCEVSMPTTPPSIYRMTTSPILESDSIKGCLLSIMDVTRMRQLEIMRSQFVSNVTHELRTPLTSIKGYVETLRRGAIANTELAERFLQIIDIESERLHNLIGDLLDLADIESGIDSDITVCKLEDIINKCIQLLSMAAEEKGVTISVDIDEGLTLKANPHRLQQLFINLVDNAIKYNVENGSILITGHHAQGKVVIKVQDTGIGIGEQHLSRIFERFYRVDKGRSRELGGTGLGLSIVKHLVGLYNGNIVIDSTEGDGTTFIIEIPS